MLIGRFLMSVFVNLMLIGRFLCCLCVSNIRPTSWAHKSHESDTSCPFVSYEDGGTTAQSVQGSLKAFNFRWKAKKRMMISSVK